MDKEGNQKYSNHMKYAKQEFNAGTPIDGKKPIKRASTIKTTNVPIPENEDLESPDVRNRTKLAMQHKDMQNIEEQVTSLIRRASKREDFAIRDMK